MTKYSFEEKLTAVQRYLDGVESFKTVAKKYNVELSLLKEWVSAYREHGIKAFQRSYTNHSIKFKMDVINYIKETGASIRETGTRFNIKHSTVSKWNHLFETEGIDALRSKKKGRPPLKKESKENKPVEGSIEALQAENERLRMENAYLKKLNALIQEKEKLQLKTKRR